MTQDTYINLQGCTN